MNALGWTLLHSLWEGAVLGLLGWAVLALARTRSARLRHGLCVALLVTQLLAFLGTWMWLSMSGETLRFELSLGPGQVLSKTAFRTALPLAGTLPGEHPGLQNLARLLESGWMLGVGLMLLRLAHAWVQARRLLTFEAEPAPEAWHARVSRLAGRMGVNRAVDLRVSPHAPSPLLSGFWKPVILLPTAALLHLEPEALEAVLAHELAHLRRLDPLTLFLQHLAETLLFYHPAVWWLSRQLRILREHCCDDDAVALLGDPLPFAEALARLEALRRQHPGGAPRGIPAVVHASQRGPLMTRIQRILQPAPSPLPAFRGLALAMALAAAGGGFLLARPQAPAPTHASVPAASGQLRLDAKSLQISGYPERVRLAHIQPEAFRDMHLKLSSWVEGVLTRRIEALKQGATQPLPAPVKHDAKGPSVMMSTASKKKVSEMLSLQISETEGGSDAPTVVFRFPASTPKGIGPEQERQLLESCRTLIQEAGRNVQAAAKHKA